VGFCDLFFPLFADQVGPGKGRLVQAKTKDSAKTKTPKSPPDVLKARAALVSVAVADGSSVAVASGGGATMVDPVERPAVVVRVPVVDLVMLNS